MGKGKTGVLGLASTKASEVPILVEGIPEEERVVSMSAGSAHVACTTELRRYANEMGEAVEIKG